MIFNGKIENKKLNIVDIEHLEEFCHNNNDKQVRIEVKVVNNSRTLAQNNAIHLYCSRLSEALNTKGLDMKAVISKDIDIMWTPVTVKEYLWKATQKIMFGKSSTTQLDKTKEIDKIYDVINKTIGERTEIYVPFPSYLDLLEE